MALLPSSCSQTNTYIHTLRLYCDGLDDEPVLTHVLLGLLTHLYELELRSQCRPLAGDVCHLTGNMENLKDFALECLDCEESHLT
jgi:hypothetical protein